MKASPTPSELAAAILLNTTNLRYLTQQIFGFYILDFVIPSKMLVIEIDGSSHDNKQAYDLSRDQFIERYGLKVIHILNKDIHTLLPIIESYPIISNSTTKWEEALGKAHDVREYANKKKTPEKCVQVVRKKKTRKSRKSRKKY